MRFSVPATDQPGADPAHCVFMDTVRRLLRLARLGQGLLPRIKTEPDASEAWVQGWLVAQGRHSQAAELAHLVAGTQEWYRHMTWWLRERAVNHEKTFSTTWYQCAVMYCHCAELEE